MANEVSFVWSTGKTLTFSVYQRDGTARETGTSMTETPAGSGLYLGSPTLIVPGDKVVVKEGSTVRGGGEFDPEIALETTISSVITADIVFRLNAGATDDDAYNNMVVSVEDVSSGDVRSRRVADYDAGNKEVTVDSDFEFALAAGDVVRIWASTYSQTADAAAVGDIVAGIWNALDASYRTQNTKGLKLSQAKGRY